MLVDDNKIIIFKLNIEHERRNFELFGSDDTQKLPEEQLLVFR
ncbi:hypothetical protein JCM19240_872 [Vibrio maritimus]|uniref:Uncharacterized protein n=1 Tax=Vibrio maritimus TaxID=990268 RepID=A0A090T5F1_9VIBR|nr:hypothetical protein JCM19240_872 [Vibrio maritimus]